MTYGIQEVAVRVPGIVRTVGEIEPEKQIMNANVEIKPELQE